MEKKADSGRWLIRVDGGQGDFALKEANLILLRSSSGGQAPPAPGVSNNITEGLDQLLAQVDSTRGSVCEAMAFCLDHAGQHADALVRRLMVGLARRGIGTDAVISRLFVVSDVLHNVAKVGAGKDLTQLRSGLQEQLPETFEKLGRLWLQQLENSEEWARGEATVKKVLKAWDEWRVFPPLYTKGLSCLLFSPVWEISAKEAGQETDERLKQKLVRWFSGLNQAQLPYECQLRGLGGKGMQTSVCRARLCHFERFWHLQPGMVVRLKGLMAAPHLNGLIGVLEHWDWQAGRWKLGLRDTGEIKSVKPENLTAESDSPGLNPVREVPNGFPPSRAGSANSTRDMEEDSLDGEPITDQELALAIAEAEAKEAAHKPQALIWRPSAHAEWSETWREGAD